MQLYVQTQLRDVYKNFLTTNDSVIFSLPRNIIVDRVCFDSGWLSVTNIWRDWRTDFIEFRSLTTLNNNLSVR